MFTPKQSSRHHDIFHLPFSLQHTFCLSSNTWNYQYLTPGFCCRYNALQTISDQYKKTLASNLFGGCFPSLHYKSWLDKEIIDPSFKQVGFPVYKIYFLNINKMDHWFNVDIFVSPKICFWRTCCLPVNKVELSDLSLNVLFILKSNATEVCIPSLAAMMLSIVSGILAPKANKVRPIIVSGMSNVSPGTNRIVMKW